MTHQNRVQGALFPNPKSWIEKAGAWLCRRILTQATQHYYDNVEALTQSRQAGIAVNAELATARSRCVSLNDEILRLKRKLGDSENSQVMDRVESILDIQPGKVVPLFDRYQATQHDVTAISAHAARLMELKYRQLKQQVQMVKAEIRGSTDSSSYLQAMQLIAEIPRLRHITSSIWDDGTVTSALEADIQQLLDAVPWLRQAVEESSEGIALFDQQAERDSKRLFRGDDG